jgi:hypothetical protein
MTSYFELQATVEANVEDKSIDNSASLFLSPQSDYNINGL